MALANGKNKQKQNNDKHTNTCTCTAAVLAKWVNFPAHFHVLNTHNFHTYHHNHPIYVCVSVCVRISRQLIAEEWSYNFYINK